MNCKDCHEVKCNAHGTDRIPSGNYCENYVHTNADRFRAMSDEEMAKFGASLPCCPPGADVTELCYPNNSCEGTDLQTKCWLNWLRQEADDGIL